MRPTYLMRRQPQRFRMSMATTAEPPRASLCSTSGWRDTCTPSSMGVLRIQESGIERQRQQVFHTVANRFPFQVGQDDLHITAEFPQDLPAGAARWCGQLRIGNHRDADK